jgi:lysophospholipase L1-like esterase
MRSPIRVCASFAAALAVLLLAAPAPAARADGLYVALGDSVGAGVASTPGHGYVDLLFSHYQSALGVTELSNRASAAGQDSGTLRTGGQLDAALADINDSSDTRVVTIDIGGNDPCPDFSSPACAFRTNFAATLADLQAALANDPGNEALIAMAYYNPDVGEPGEAGKDQALLGTPAELRCSDTGAEVGLNDIIAQEAANHGALLANPYPAFKATGQAYMSDDRHPNDAGHAAIAQAFENAGEPCPPEPPERPPVKLPPSNVFHFGKVKKNKHKGTATLFIQVPGPGELDLAKTKKVKPDEERAEAAGEEKLSVKAKRTAKRRLAHKGTAKVKAEVTYRPTGGAPSTQSQEIKLVKQ